MKYVSIDELSRQNSEANAKEGWSEMHLTLRTLQENTPAAIQEFEQSLNLRIVKMLEGIQVTVIDEDEVYLAWRKHGLTLPKQVMSPLAMALTQPDGSYVILFNIKGLREQGPNDLEQVVVHEITHLRQLESGRLSFDESSAYWEGKKYCPQSFIQQTMSGEGIHGVAYMQCLLPWELEAYEAAYQHAEEYDIKSSNRQLKFVLACAREYHKWLNGGMLGYWDYIYQGQVLSPFGECRINIAGRELMRGALLSDMANMVEVLGLSADILARETTHLFLRMDMEMIMRVILGYGMFDRKLSGFFTTFFNSFPENVFTVEAYERIRELIAAGK